MEPARSSPTHASNGNSTGSPVGGPTAPVQGDGAQGHGGRLLGCRGKPDFPKTLEAGLAQITAGLAWWFRRYAKEQGAEDRGRCEHAELEAKIRRAGLWSEKAPTPPWEWRRGARSQ
jgi:endonuclease YncB( thermonuclease family)